MWIATETWDVTRDGARRQLEESLARLQTGYVDEGRLHNVRGFDRLDQIPGKRGALAAAIQARDKGGALDQHQRSHRPSGADRSDAPFPL